jgi:hypothetical protein
MLYPLRVKNPDIRDTTPGLLSTFATITCFCLCAFSPFKLKSKAFTGYSTSSANIISWLLFPTGIMG